MENLFYILKGRADRFLRGLGFIKPRVEWLTDRHL
jgi:hypothetical protein